MDKRAGQRFGSYSLLRLLGQGHASEVYLAEHVERKTQVAIKLLQMKLTGSDQESFLTQTHTIKQLKHPHIVSIWETGIQGNTPFLAMTYAPHGSLRTSHPTGTQLPQQQILSYVQQITAALQYLHNQQLIYHDLRPQNLLLQAPNNIVLADFTLSLISQNSHSLNMQEMMGDVTYMAPEQLRGKLVPASDQYALGIIIYEWLSGTAPFQGTFTEVANQHAFTPPTPLHVKVPGVTPAVEEVVQIALSKEPQWRFASLQAFSKAFEQACQGHQPPLEARTFRVPEKPASPNKQEGHQKSASSKQPATQLSSDSAQSSTLQTLLTVPTPPQNPSRFRRPTIRTILFSVLALLIIASGSSLLYFSPWQHSTQTKAQSTGTAQIASFTATAQEHLHATTIAQAYTNAEATAEASANAEAAVTATAMPNLYTQSTQGIPVINDSLTANDKNRWDENTSSKHESCTFIGKAYHVTEPQPPGSDYSPSLYPCFANNIKFSNFALQANMAILKGDEGGLVFMADNAHTNYCFFSLFYTGGYRSACYINNIYRLSLNSLQTVVGNKKPQVNLLTVIVRNRHVFLYVNKQYIGSMQEDFLLTGEIGVFASNDTNSTEVAFNNIQVWQL